MFFFLFHLLLVVGKEFLPQQWEVETDRESGRVTWRANHSVRQRALPFILSLCICICIAHQSVCSSIFLSVYLPLCLSVSISACSSVVCMSVLCLVHFLLLCQFRTGNFKHGNHAQATSNSNNSNN